MQTNHQFTSQGKSPAIPYAKAVLDMLPKTEYSKDTRTVHESINDLPVHPATTQQIFHPTSESRVFTRADAAAVAVAHCADPGVPFFLQDLRDELQNVE